MRLLITCLLWAILLVSLATCDQYGPQPVRIREITVTPMEFETATPKATLNTVVPVQETLSPAKKAIIEEENSGIERSEKIIDALDDYYHTEGHYPERLNELIPLYLEEIPETITGQEYEYILTEEFDYILMFNVSRRGEVWFCGYLRDMELWDCGRTNNH
jgi:hypothetical protein